MRAWLGLLIFWSTCSLAAPNPIAGSQAWWCTLKGEIGSNPEHFFVYARDAWQGPAVMDCRSQRTRVQVPMRVTYNSLARGMGFDRTMQLGFEVVIWTVQNPAHLQVQSALIGLAEGSMVHWNFVSEKTELTGSAWIHPRPLSLLPLTQGSLSIRPVEKL